MSEDFAYVWNLENNERAEQKQTHRHREHFAGCQMGGCLGKGDKVRGLGSTIGSYKIVMACKVQHRKYSQ